VQDGRAVDVHPWAALFENSYFWHELIHMYIAAYMVAGFLTASVYAWALLRGRNTRYNRTALIIPLTVAALAGSSAAIAGRSGTAQAPFARTTGRRAIDRDAPRRCATAVAAGSGAEINVAIGWTETQRFSQAIGTDV